MSELANNKSIRKEVQDLGETLGITPNGKTNQQKIRSIGEQASDGTYATKEYVNTLMSGALKRQIVETLPETDIDTNTIYMVLDSTSTQQGNVYNEYLYINNAWELIGTTAMETPHLYKHRITLTCSQGSVYADYYDDVDTAYNMSSFTAKYAVADAYIVTNTNYESNRLLLCCYFQHSNPNSIMINILNGSTLQNDFITNLTDTVTQIF